MIAITRPKANPAMPDTKPAKEYWSDWFPRHPATLSVDELFDHLRERDVRCDLRTLQSWQAQGVIPYPVRQRRGAGVYAAYPAIAVDFIELVRQMQGHGLKLPEIGPRLRARAKGNSDRDLQMELREAIKQVAQIQHQITGVPVRKVDITLTDDLGMETHYSGQPMVRWRVGGAKRSGEETK